VSWVALPRRIREIHQRGAWADGHMSAVRQAIILARGLGTRMRAPGATLDADTAAVADSGIKALIAIDRPFLDYVLGNLADVGVNRVILVVGPDQDALRRYYGTLSTTRITIEFAIQAHPLGTAQALLAAETAVADGPFLVINSDNHYPRRALAALAHYANPGLIGFRRSGLLLGNIPAERIARFAAINVDSSGNLERIIEKPETNVLARMESDPMVSMNCWCFTAEIFAACRMVRPSARGELELPDAVSHELARGQQLRVIESREPVLDLSCRDDISAVRQALSGQQVAL
jgi:dTDP-glucose pyrophosphorylase